MNTRYPISMRAILALALLGCGAGFIGTGSAGEHFTATALLRAAKQAGSELHAEYGHFGALGALFGRPLRIPVSSATCEQHAEPTNGCAGRG